MTTFFVTDLVAAYPDAKFILTTRDPRRWVQSVNSTLLRMAALVRSFPFLCLGPLSAFLAAWSEFGRLAPRHIWKGSRPGNDAEAIQTYNDQYVELCY